MAWKIEQWLSEVFPGEENIYSEYRSLPSRELAILCASVLDIALAELLSLRLIGYEKEIGEFLGLNGDGRAPAGSFGSRIHLGLLVGLLTKNDASILKTIKEIRNLFAHRVNLNFLSPQVVKSTRKLSSLWIDRTESLIKAGLLSGTTEKIKEVATYIPTIPEAGEGLLLSVFTVYHAYFHRMHHRVDRIDTCI